MSHLLFGETGLSGTFGYGIAVSGWPIKKCPGVSAQSLIPSEEIAHSGLKLRATLIWVSKVHISLNGNVDSPMTFRIGDLAILTVASSKPLKWGDPGGAKLNLVPVLHKMALFLKFLISLFPLIIQYR